MLPEWYFCCCIDASPSLTKAFLCIIDVLSSRKYDAQLLRLSYQELQRTDLRMRIYALPHALASCNLHGPSVKSAEATRAYFDGLLRGVPEDIYDPLNGLFQALLLEDEARFDLLPALELYLKAIKGLPDRIPTPRPYFDLKEFFPETAALAILADQCSHNVNFITNVSSLLEDETSEVNGLVRNALSYKYGRKAFLLAVTVTQLIPTESFPKSELESTIWKNHSLTPAFEPDLLHATAEVLFSYNPQLTTVSEKDSVIRRLLREAIWFSSLRRLWQMLPYEERVKDVPALNYIGSELTGDRELTFPIIYWQSILWDLGARIAPDDVAKLLIKYWRPPTSYTPGNLDIPQPQIDQDARSWKNQILALASLRDIDTIDIQAPSYIASGAEEAEFPSDWWTWIFLSPWVQLRGRTQASTGETTGRNRKLLYATASDKHEILIRLLAAIPIATKLLDELPDSDERRLTFASFIAHASDVLTIFQNWLKNFDKPEKLASKSPTLPTPMTGLALFGGWLINNVGTGRIASIPPELFISLLRQSDEASFKEQRRPQEEIIFRRVILPEVLMQWITDAYPGSTSSDGPGRWLSPGLIEEIYSYFTERHHDDHDEYVAALVMRFLRHRRSDESSTPREDFNLYASRNLDWQLRGKRDNWELDHRLLLLTDTSLPPEAWEPGWNDPNWSSGLGKRKRKLDTSTPLVRALERAASLKPGRQVSQVTHEKWQVEWKNYLNRIDKNYHLDRYVRLRLLELIDDEALDKLDDQELIMLVLLEYGSTYDLKELFWRIFPSTSGGLKPVSETRRRLQISMLRAMYRQLESDEINPDQNRAHQGAQDPRTTLIYHLRTELIRETLAQLAYQSRFSSSPTNTDHIWRLISELERASFKSRISKNIKEQKLYIEQRDSRLYAVTPQGQPSIKKWALRGGVYDPNLHQATLFYDDIDLTGIHNLFESPMMRTRYHEGEVNRILAVLVDKEDISPDDVLLVFNCGLRHPLKPVRSKEDATDFNVGDYVSLPVMMARDESHNPRLRVPRAANIRKLRRQITPGDVEPVCVVEECDVQESDAPRGFYVKRDDAIIPESLLDRRSFDPELSRAFRIRGQVETTSYAIYGQDGRWTPLDRGLLDLLTDNFTDPRVNAVVLTFIKAAEGPLKESAWRFSARPGFNYLLRHDDFALADFTRLNALLSELAFSSEDPFGLLVTLKPIMIDGRVYLSLAEGMTVQVGPPEMYPELRVPFDMRNLEWRRIFLNIDAVYANKEGGAWYYQLGDRTIPGYRQRIKVKWGKYQPHRSAERAEFLPQDWGDAEQRRALVVGEHPRQRWISVDRYSAAQFLSDWLDISKGNLVFLERSDGRLLPDREGYVRGYTKENMMVNVDIESLSMRPFSPDDKEPILERRPALITKVRRTPHRVEVDINDVPAEALAGETCAGILIQVPEYRVLWQTPVGPRFSNLIIYGLDQNRTQPHPGWGIRGELVGDTWHFDLIELFIQARALWQAEESSRLQDGLRFLGEAFDRAEHRVRPIAEVRPGHFAFLHYLPKGIRNLAVRNESTFEGGIKPDKPVRITTRDFYKKRDFYRRAIISQDEYLVPGVCRGDVPWGELKIEKIGINISRPIYEPDDIEGAKPYYDLGREFVLTAPMHRRRVAAGRDSQENSEVWEERLRDYWKSERDLSAKYDRSLDEGRIELLGSDLSIKVPADGGRGSWTSFVELAKDEGAYVSGNRYGSDARVRLFESSGKVKASLRRVEDLTPEAFKRRLGVRYGEPVTLHSNKLYYVGPEEHHPIKKIRYPERCHRFEMGYGKTVLVPESRLLYEEEGVSYAEFILFHGDHINKFTFTQGPEADAEVVQDDSEEGEKGPQCYMKIDVAFVLSNTRTLYKQRAKHQIVHRLDVEQRDDRIIIKSIKGFDESRLSDTHPFERVSALLDDDSQRRLLNQIAEGNINAGSEFVILGRLDEKRLLESFGREIFFEHVRLSFADSDLGPPLLDGDMVLLEARGVRQLTNDIGVEVGASYLSPADVGADWKKANMLIRKEHFSVRPDLLQRMLRQSKRTPKAPEGLQSRLVFVRLIKKQGYVRPLATLLSGMLLRKAEALYGEIAREKNKPLFASVVYYDNAELQLELKPGLFVRIKQSQIAQPRPPVLDKGAVVRITNAGEADRYRLSFHITLATFGDARYVPRTTRPAVVFPKDSLFERAVMESDEVGSAAFWQRKKHFMVGGLPGVSAAAGTYDEERMRWLSPRVNDMISLMMTRHPKIVRLGCDANKHFWIGLPGADILVGALHVEGSGLQVKYVQLDSAPGAPDCPVLDWGLLTFADEPARDVIVRSRRERWRYYNNDTGWWIAKGRPPQTITLKPQNVWEGPIFFEAQQAGYALRYSMGGLTKFGYPVEEMIYSLRENYASKGSYPVAGASSLGGLWIELAPGRVVEVPAQLFIWRSTSEGEESLAHLNWESFASGDTVELELVSRGPYEFDRITLKDWRPGPRNALGQQRALLPVEKTDSSTGAVHLGAGQFKLTIPSAEPPPDEALFLLLSDNKLRSVDFGSEAGLGALRKGDTALLGIGSDGMPTILGLRKSITLRVASIEMNSLQPDSLLSDAIARRNDKIFLQLEPLRELIEAAGGALPITVEWVVPENSLLYFSLRHQCAAAAISKDKISLAHLVNPIGDGRAVILRTGGGLIRMNMTDIISGLPSSLSKKAAEALKENQITLWLRGTGEGSVTVGLPETTESHEILVEALCVIVDDNVQEEHGLICRAIGMRALYWLPASHAAWTELSEDQLRRLFVNGKTFTVRRSSETWRGAYVSVTDVHSVSREFDELAIGKELSINILEDAGSQSDGARHYLAQSFHSNIILDFVTYKNRPKNGDFIITEVIKRNFSHPYSLTVAPFGERRLYLDLPSWMTNSEGDMTPLQEHDYLTRSSVRQSEYPESTFSTEQLATAEDYEIDELLYHAFDIRKSTDRLDFLINVVREWHKRNYKDGHKTELQAAHPVMAVIILNECARRAEQSRTPVRYFPHWDPDDIRTMTTAWRKVAGTILRDVGERSLRSMHVEVLSKEWLCHSYNKTRIDGLWMRLQQLRKYFLKNQHSGDTEVGRPSALSVEDINTMRRFSYAVMLRNDEELFPVAAALLAAVGNSTDIIRLYNAVQITSRLVDIHRAFPPAELQLWSYQTVMDRLEAVLSTINVKAQDIILLQSFLAPPER
ncbi:MAG TPA: hypothetical protein VN282_01980 [Pyrinomonadaceae bacterium]|nr:hypothetical protein [Pyrinomonadaceae bacterium]